jgi:beta-galactosidase
MFIRALSSRLRALLCVAAIAPSLALAAAPRERLSLDDGWRFAFGHAHDAEKDFRHGLRPFFFAKAGFGDGPADLNFDDRAWRQLDLPHDWAVELPFDPRGNTNHGSKALGRAFPENSVGWYRRELAIPAADQGRRVAIELDGVFRDSVVWVNGHYIGREHSGYSSVRYDISSYLNYGGRNVVAVRVDATGEEGWWYEGAGIYRHVWLSKTGPLHVGHWGTFVRAEVKGQRATLTVDATVANAGPEGERFTLEHEVLDPDGRRVATRRLPAQAVGADAQVQTRAQIDVNAPRLWSLQTPQRYTLVTQVRRGGQVVDRYETPFGIRTIRFDADRGFFLNREHVKLHGTNNHQDHAGVGVALPDALQDWRLRRLKEMGVNAIRSAHHPATPELLDACDRLGILVIDEHRVMGTAPEIRHELERLIRRDRNHPSVILWSVGNEEWAIENTEMGTRLAREMQAIVKRMDPTRGVTLAASSSGGPEGTAVGSEVLGFNYKAQHDIDAMHKRFPERPMVVTEEGLTFATRGIYVDDPARAHVAAYDKPSGGASTASIEQAWRFNAERPYIAGMFVWTGFDYRGETTPYGWPAISSQFGMLDTTGAFKDTGWYLKAAWTKAPMVHLLPHWNWPGKEGQAVDVRVYGNTEEVELLQDGRSLGRKPLARHGHLQWNVSYAPGELTARGFNGGRLVASQTVATTGPARAASMATDRTTLRADGRDVAVLEVTVRDAQGRVVPVADNLLRFEAKGPVRLLGMGNGDPGSHEADKPADRHRFARLQDWAIRDDDHDEAPDEALADAARAADPRAWRDPFQWLPEDKRPAPAPYHAVRTRFARPDLAAGERAELFVAEIVPGQRLFLNGAAAVTRPTGDGRLLVELDAARLKDQNELVWHLKAPAGGLQPLVDAAQAGARWAQLRVTTPAAPWQRRAFNGRAQLIVQSTGAAGLAVVTATGEGLEAAQVKIDFR